MCDDSDTCVFVSSTESLQFYPDNSPSKFTNYLSSPINLNGKSEVGISQIILKSVKQPRPLFKDGDEKLVHVYEVPNTEMETLTVEKHPKLDDWLNAVNVNLLAGKFPAKII